MVWQIGEQSFSSEDLLTKLGQYQLLPIFKREWIIDQVIASLSCSSEEERQAYEQFKRHHHLNDEMAIERYCDLYGITEEQLKTIAVRHQKITRFKQMKFGHQLESDFLKRQHQFEQVIYSLIWVKEFGLIQELYFRLLEKEASFADLAKQHSQGREAATCGVLGPVTLKMIPPPIQKFLLGSETDQLIPPAPLGEGWMILRLEKRISARLDRFIAQRLINDRFEVWLSEQMRQEVLEIIPESA